MASCDDHRPGLIYQPTSLSDVLNTNLNAAIYMHLIIDHSNIGEHVKVILAKI